MNEDQYGADFGRIAYGKCLDLEARLDRERGGFRFLSRVCRYAGNVRESSDSVIAAGGGRVYLCGRAVFSGNASELALYRNGQKIYSVRLTGNSGSAAVPVENEGRAEYRFEADNALEIQITAFGAPALRAEECLSIFEGELYLQKGGKISKFGAGLAQLGRLPCFGAFAMVRTALGARKWTLADGELVLSEPEADSGSPLAANVAAFCAEGDELWFLRGGRLVSARLSGSSLSVLSSELCREGEGLFLLAGSGSPEGRLVRTTGNSSFLRVSAGRWKKLCDGTSPCYFGGRLYYSRGGMIESKHGSGTGEETPESAGNFAAVLSGKLIAVCGSDLRILKE